MYVCMYELRIHELSCDEKWQKISILFANFAAAMCTITVFY